MVSRLVVASFTEDLSWLDEVKGWDVVVYQKNAIDPKLKFNQVLLPNVGRETHTFLHHLFLGDDADRVAFVQGSPKDHCHNLMDLLHSDKVDIPLGNLMWCDKFGLPHTTVLEIESIHLSLFGKQRESYLFSQGAQHILSKETLNKRNRIFWKRCLELLLEDGKIFTRGHEFERSWGYIFDLEYATRTYY